MKPSKVGIILKLDIAMISTAKHTSLRYRVTDCGTILCRHHPTDSNGWQ